MGVGEKRGIDGPGRVAVGIRLEVGNRKVGGTSRRVMDREETEVGRIMV